MMKGCKGLTMFNILLGTEVPVSALWIENIVTRLIGYNQILNASHYSKEKHRHAMHARVIFWGGGWITWNIVIDVFIISKGKKSINAEKNENVELIHT